jgi:outer membrane protein
MQVRVTRSFLRAVSPILLVLAFVLPAHAQAQSTKSKAPAAGQSALVPAIIIVDLPQVLHDSKAGKGVQATLNQESQAYSKEVAKQEDELQKMRSDLERQRTVLAPDAFDVKAKAFQQHYEELDHAVQAKRQAFQQAYNEAMLKVEKAALQIVASVASERGANLVLAKQATILQSKESDVTAEVIERLDKTLSSVSVTIPKAPTGEASASKTKDSAPDKKN